MRRWLNEHAGGSPPWPEHMRGAGPILSNLDLERAQVLDRYHQHTRHCVHCRTALRNTELVASGASALSGLAAAGAALAMLVKLFLPLAGAVGGVGGWIARKTGVGAGSALDGEPAATIVPKWLAAAAKACGVGELLLVALLAAGVALAARALARQFYAGDFERKAFPPSGTPGGAGASAPAAA